MRKIRVLIIEDSAFMRKLITNLLSEDQQIEVVGFARNGKDGVERIKKYKPDVVTMDIEMPIMNGLDSLRIIMRECPVPVIMLASSTSQGAENTLLAMQLGAFDFIAKPSGNVSLDLHKIKAELKMKIKAAGLTNVDLLQTNIKLSKQEMSIKPIYSKIELDKKGVETPGLFEKVEKIIAIGTSTGGPRALQCVLSKLPASIDAPVLIVQHMPAGFTKSLANRLDHIRDIHVKEAEDGETLYKGTAYIAPGGFHLTVKKVGTILKAVLEKTAPVNGHRPSVDTLFHSISQLSSYSIIAVIMTGMGSDGTKGLIDLKNKVDVISIAESEISSIVFGMPKAAISTNLVDFVEEVENIAHRIVKYC